MGTLPQRFSHVFLSCLSLITLFHFASAFKSSLNAHFFHSYLYCILSCVYIIVLYTRGLLFFFFFISLDLLFQWWCPGSPCL